MSNREDNLLNKIADIANDKLLFALASQKQLTKLFSNLVQNLNANIEIRFSVEKRRVQQDPLHVVLQNLEATIRDTITNKRFQVLYNLLKKLIEENNPALNKVLASLMELNDDSTDAQLKDLTQKLNEVSFTSFLFLICIYTCLYFYLYSNFSSITSQ